MSEPFGEDMARDFAALGICPGCLVGIAGGGSVSRFDDETKVLRLPGSSSPVVTLGGQSPHPDTTPHLGRQAISGGSRGRAHPVQGGIHIIEKVADPA
jgi:hypothetical protein